MRLLVCTQAVDLDDRALGFFHRWLEEMAKHFQSVEVICLKEGRHSLPANVRVHSLGKENGAARISYLWRFYRYAFGLRRSYDAVFVHMNQEYVLLAGVFWMILKKRVVLWRNHKMGNVLTDIAARLSDAVCYTSPESYTAQEPHAVRMPIGIDTGFFRLPAKPAPFDTVLFLGRLDPVKKPAEFLDAVDILARQGLRCRIDGYGDPTDPNAPHVAAIRERIFQLEERKAIQWHSGVPNEETPRIYAEHAIYVNITPSGSFDKTIGEAMASGCVVVVANAAVRGIIPDALLVKPDSPQDIARGIEAAIMLSPEEREEIITKSVAYISTEHSLKALVGQLASLLRPPVI